MGMAGLITFLLWEVQSQLVLGVWLILILVTGVARIQFFREYRTRRPTPDRIPRWEFFYRLTILTYFLAWGLGGLWVMPPDSLVHQLALLYFLMGLAGAAISVLSGGGDVVYLFNHFQSGHWPAPGYQALLNTFSSLEKLGKLPRRHAVTYREVVIPGEAYRPPLPASGEALSFDLPLGPTPLAEWQAEAIIEVAAWEGGGAAPGVSVNGVAGKKQSNEAMQNGNRLLTYSIPLNALPGRNKDTIMVTAGGQHMVNVFRVEVRVYPGG